MRISMPDFLGACDSAAARSTTVNAPLHNLDSHLGPLLQSFLEQSTPLRSIVAIGCHQFLPTHRDELLSTSPVGVCTAALLRLVAAENGRPAIIALEPIRTGGHTSGVDHGYSLDSLARRAREMSGVVLGDDLLLLAAEALNEMMTPLDEDFGFRAVITLSRRSSSDQ